MSSHSTPRDITLKIYLRPDGRRPRLRDARNYGDWLLRKSNGRGVGRIPLVSYEVSLM